jgi:hypothetical protein
MPEDHETWVYRTPTTGPVWKRRGVPDLPPYAPTTPQPVDPPPADPGGTTTPTVPTTPTTAVTPELPFELTAAMRTQMASRVPVYAHWFPPYPISLDNANPKALGGAGDTYDNSLLPATGTNAAVGGFLDERPLPRAPLTGDYVLQDCVTDIMRAKRIGLDGFTVEGLSFGTSQNWGRVKKLIAACEQVNDPNFKLIYMPDGGGGGTADAVTLGTEMAGILKSAAFKRLADGRVIVAPFAPESAPAGGRTWGAAEWQQAADQCVTSGGPRIAYWFCYVAAWSTTAPKFDAAAYGHGRWGGRSANSLKSTNGDNRGAVAALDASTTLKAKFWMHFAATQDSRRNPNNHKYWEARNTEAYRNSWEANWVQPVDFTQIPTWNDLSEATQIWPSPSARWCWADLTTFYMVRAKLGYWPTVVRDCVYLSHRIHPATGTTFTGPQTTFQTLQDATGTPAANEVEALVFVPVVAGSVVTVTVSGQPVSFDLSKATAAGGLGVPQTTSAPGVFSCRVGLPASAAVGAIKAEIVRGGAAVATVNSKWAVSKTQPREDLLYRMVCSLPEGKRP